MALVVHPLTRKRILKYIIDDHIQYKKTKQRVQLEAIRVAFEKVSLRKTCSNIRIYWHVAGTCIYFVCYRKDFRRICRGPKPFLHLGALWRQFLFVVLCLRLFFLESSWFFFPDAAGLTFGEMVNWRLDLSRRLSDHLFVMARFLNARGKKDVLWKPGVNRGAKPKVTKFSK